MSDVETAIADSRRELEQIESRNPGNMAYWPAGQRQRHENLSRRIDRLSSEARRARLSEMEPTARTTTSRGHRIGGVPLYAAGQDPMAIADEARRLVDYAYRSGVLPDHGAEKVFDLLEQGSARDQSAAARWATVTGTAEYTSAFIKLVADPVRGHMLWSGPEQDAFRAVEEYRGMTLTPDTAGGFMVPLVLDPAIMLTSAGSINPLRRISRVVTTTSEAWQGVTSAGVTSEWKAEAVQAADATPALAGPSIPVHFGDSFVPFSFEVGMDAVGFVTELQKLLVDSADQHMATAYTTGTGTGQPKGIITAIVGTASVVVGTEAFPSSQVYSTQNALPPRFSPNAQWCANLAIINLLSQRETTAGARLFPELSDGRLLNRPMNELSNMDGVIDVGAENYCLLYGDFSNFIIVDRIGTTLELIPNLVGANQRPTGQRGAMLWFRTGSDAPVFNAFRLLNLT